MLATSEGPYTHTHILLVPLVGHGRPGLPRDRPPKGFQQTYGPSQGTYNTATGKDIGAGPHRGLNITGTCAGTSTPGGATKPSFFRAVHPEDIHTATGRSVGASPNLGTSLVAGDCAGTCPTRGTSTTPPGEAPGPPSLRVTNNLRDLRRDRPHPRDFNHNREMRRCPPRLGDYASSELRARKTRKPPRR